MKKLNAILLAAALLAAAVSCGKETKPSDEENKPGTPEVLPGDGTISVQWGEPQRVCPGYYARVHALNDGRYVLVYAVGTDGYLRFSDDGCKSFPQAQKVFIASNFKSDAGIEVANSEFAQLSATNPHHPGRMIYAANLRPRKKASSKTPYSIAIITSDDNGAKWSEIRNLYSSRTWDTDVEKGCYEPYILELPDGRLQIYFADETPYYKDGLNWQNISMLESTDGGDTWSTTPKVVSYNTKCRDGMPVAMTLNDRIFVAIEENGLGHPNFRPKIVCTTIDDNWKMPVLSSSADRFNPLKTPLDSDKIYAGAPYLIHTDNYIVLSYLSSEGAATVGTKNATMELSLCAIRQMKSGKFASAMQGQFRPFDVDQTKSQALWGSLCHTGGDTILAVTQWDGAVWLRPGLILTTK